MLIRTNDLLKQKPVLGVLDGLGRLSKKVKKVIIISSPQITHTWICIKLVV